VISAGRQAGGSSLVALDALEQMRECLEQLELSRTAQKDFNLGRRKPGTQVGSPQGHQRRFVSGCSRRSSGSV
jgi:hypothetical protein